MDSKNSIATRDILRNFTFTGVMTLCENSPEININITCNSVSTLNTIQVFINYSNDLINIKQEFHPIDVIDNVTQYNIRSRPLARYFSVSLINGLNNIIKFNMETSLKSAVGYTDQDGVSVNVDNFPTSFFIYNTGFEVTNDVLVNGHVVVDTMPAVEISNFPLYTNIDNFPSSQVVTLASTEVSNFPSSQVVTLVSTEVSNFPSSQVVTLASTEVSNFPSSNDVIITAIEPSLTFLCQERPTTEVFFSTSAGNQGIFISGSPKVIRNMSINTISSVIVYVYLYDLADVPTSTNVPTFVFTVKDSNNVVFNPLDHKFVNGLGLRATTTYNGTTSPALNSVFVNMTLSD